MERIRNALTPLLLAASLSVGAAESIDINSADAAALAATLVGVGDAKAQAIVDYRREFGPFESPDDLTLVQGIGEATVARNRERIRLGK